MIPLVSLILHAVTSNSSAVDVLNLIGIPTGLTGFGVPLWLWLSHRVMLTTDHNRQMQEKDLDLTNVRADRNAWREAHQAEVNARISAERAASSLLEQANLSAQLLDALRQELRR